MFKEIKILKLTIFATLLVAILYMTFLRLENTVIYFDQPSYFPGDTVKVFVTSNFSREKAKLLPFKNYKGEKLAQLEIIATKNHENESNMIDGFAVDSFYSFVIPSSIKSGIYTLSDTIPLIVKSRMPVEVTVVYPYANNHIYTNSNGKSIFENKSKGVSLKRNSKICDYSKSMNDFFEYIDKNYETSYVTDLDLEDTTQFFQSDVIVFYGIISFWTPEMRSNFLRFNAKGGSTLVAADNFMANIFWWEKEDQKLAVKYNLETGALLSWWSHAGVLVSESIGFSYPYGGKPMNVFEPYYKVYNNKHPIFKDISNAMIPVKSEVFSGTSISWENELPIISNQIKGLDTIQILAYNRCKYKKLIRNMGGLLLIKSDSLSGTIVSMGCRDWFSKNNYKTSSIIQKVTHNTIDFLVPKKE